MENPTPLVLFFTAIGFIVGAAVVYFVMRNEARKQQKLGPLDLSEERGKRFQEVAGLWRERAGGKLAVWSGDKMLGDPKLLAAEERQRLESAGRELLAWLGVADKPQPEALEQPLMDARLASVVGAPPAPPTVPVVQAAAAATQEPVPAGPAPVLPEAAPADEAGKPPKPLSIVEQINDILQGMVKDTPLAARSIRLVEDPREGVIVLVGLDRYKGVDSVPDAEIKATLRRAAGEWERRVGKVRR